MTITRELRLRPMAGIIDGAFSPYCYQFAPLVTCDVFVRARNLRDAAERLHIPLRRIGSLNFVSRWPVGEFWRWWEKRTFSRRVSEWWQETVGAEI